MPKREYVPSEFNGKQISSYFRLVFLKFKKNAVAVWDLVLIVFTAHLDAVG